MMHLAWRIEDTDSMLNHHDTLPQDGFTPLYIAVAEGHLEVVTLLLDREANVNLADGVSGRQ